MEFSAQGQSGRSVSGGPRAARVRIGLIRAAAWPRAGECACVSRKGRLAADAASACDGAEVPPAKPGNNGQVIGAVSIGVDPGSACAIMAAICFAIAQWCAPCRRQHGGRRDSSLASISPVRGQRPKTRTSRMERARRISTYATRQAAALRRARLPPSCQVSSRVSGVSIHSTQVKGTAGV